MVNDYEIIVLEKAAEHGLSLSDVHTLLGLSNGSAVAQKLKSSGFSNLHQRLASNGIRYRKKKEKQAIIRQVEQLSVIEYNERFDEEGKRRASYQSSSKDKLVAVQGTKAATNGSVNGGIKQPVIKKEVIPINLEDGDVHVASSKVESLDNCTIWNNGHLDSQFRFPYSLLEYKNSDELKQVIQDRMEYLNWSNYKLAKERILQDPDMPNDTAASRFHSAIQRTLENPATSKLETVLSLLFILGGKLYVDWDMTIEPESSRVTDQVMLKRIRQLEKELAEVKSKLDSLDSTDSTD